MATPTRSGRPVTPASARTVPVADATKARLVALGLTVIAVGLAAVALLGPLGWGVVAYRVTPTLRSQTLGLDATSLLVVAPLALAAAVLALRRRPLGPVLALGIGAYTSYMSVQYVLGPDYGRLPGTNQQLFPLFLVVFTAGWLVALTAWTAIDSAQLVRSRRHELLVARLVLPVLAVLAFARYLPALADWMSAAPADPGYRAGPTFAWTIALLDLGVFLPATVLTCVGLGRGAPWARKALALVVGWFGLVGPAVAAMGLALYLTDDPTATAGNTIFLTVLGLAFAVLAVVVLRPPRRDRGEPSAPPRAGARRFRRA